MKLNSYRSPANAIQEPRLPGSKHAQHDACETEVSDFSCDTHAYWGGAPPSPESLSCEERLLSPCGEELAAPPTVNPATDFLRSAANGEPADRAAVLELIRNEAERQETVRPSSTYLSRHPIDASMRGMAVSWVAYVVNACSLGRPTLYLAVSYFDCFMSQAKDVPSSMLQLIATASLSVAAKQEEAVQPTAAEWTAIADNAFTVEDLVRAEWLVIHQLDWQLRTPTACVFLHLFASALPQMTSKAFQTANYMLEMSILDCNMLAYDYSTVGAAAVVAAFQLLGMDLDSSALLRLAPSLIDTDVAGCVDLLMQQHMNAASG